MNKAKELWPEALNSLPMNDEHKSGLKSHWRRLHDDFKIS
jgi:serine/threonine-protein kinase HipA